MKQRWIRQDAVPGRRIALRAGSKTLYYDIDGDGTVYWLLVRRNGHIERRLVKDATFAHYIRTQAERRPPNADLSADSSDGVVPDSAQER